MQKFSKWNRGYRYLLMIIEVFSKYGWIVALKDKKGETIAQAFEKIFKEGRVLEREGSQNICGPTKGKNTITTS